MPSLFHPALPVEHPAGPLHGYKLAHPMLSADGRAAAFGGIWSSSQAVYRAEDTAVCFWNQGHSPPKRRCSCGFYCLHDLEAARAMACEARYRSTVILAVEVSGRFVRYEQGFRYSGQRVLSVRLHRCECGRPATVLVDSGTGVTGWLRLQPRCLRCSGPQRPFTLPQYAALLGGRVPVDGDESLEGAGPIGGTLEATAGAEGDPASSLSLLAAEVALLQARVDSLQAELHRRSG